MTAGAKHLTSPAVARRDGDAPRGRFELAEWKLRFPVRREGTVPRLRLVERLVASAEPVVSITGPPGYGKSTLLAQWADASDQPVVPVSLDPGDNDPAVLLAYIAGALDRIERVDVDAVEARMPHGSSVAVTVARRVAAAMASMRRPVTLVLDHAEAVRNPRCRDAVAELAAHLPPGHRLGVATRGEAPLPLGTLRSTGGVLELGVDDLAMGLGEARALIEGAGATIGDEHLAELVGRSEGWPVALYMAALAAEPVGGGLDLRAARDVEIVAGLSGDDRFFSDYLRLELLSRLPDRTVTFLTRTSVLDRLSGPLCDSMLHADGSGALLEALARSNLLVVPLDRRGDWYRYHTLFREMLRAELDRREPRTVPALHARAAAWHEAGDEAESAIDHAEAAGDGEMVARLVGRAALPTYASGRVDTCMEWFAWLEAAGVAQARPEVAVLGAVLHALLGNAAAADEWAAMSETGDAEGRPPDGSTMASWHALLRAFLCRSGVADVRRDAELALEGLTPGSQWRAAALVIQGLALVIDDEPGEADVVLSRAVEVARHLDAAPAASMALAERALLALGRRDATAAEDLAAQALAVVAERDLDSYPLTALVFLAAGRVAIQRGEVAEAGSLVARAAVLRVGLTHAVPHLAVQVRLELVRAYLELADAAGARQVLREVRDVVQVRPDLGTLPAQADDLRAKLAAMGPGTMGASSLTPAELRLLPMLPTHLTFREMGERLHVSRHTVKTQAMSVYRKLGVSSRREAIERVQEVGLLGG